MTEAAEQSVLRRMVSTSKQPAPAAVPLTAARAVRLALSRAAEDFIGLKVKVTSVSEDTVPLDDVLTALNDGLMMNRLSKDGVEVGVIAFDQGTVAAVVEMQTTGILLDNVSVARPVTLVDATLVEPLGVGFLSELVTTSMGTKLAGWVDHVTTASRFETCWDIGLKLSTGSFRLMRIDIVFGTTERTGSLWIGLPAPGSRVIEPEDTSPNLDWRSTFEHSVMQAPTVLTAILHRFELSLNKVNQFEVGQVVPLAGCTVGSVRLEGMDGRLVAKARLGQSDGYIAVRVQTPKPQMLDELVTQNALPAITIQETI